MNYEFLQKLGKASKYEGEMRNGEFWRLQSIDAIVEFCNQ